MISITFFKAKRSQPPTPNSKDLCHVRLFKIMHVRAKLRTKATLVLTNSIHSN